MRLKRFSGSAVNGYLDFDISFFDELSFITGINGSGKTTALNSIIALIMPRLDFLATQEFNSLKVEFSHANKDVSLFAEKEDEGTKLSCSLFENSILIEPYEQDRDMPPSRQHEYEREYYHNMLQKHSKSEVFSYILSLPTPMYLGLDRRAVSFDDIHNRITRPTLMRSRRRKPTKRNIFSLSLRQSLGEALDFADFKYKEARFARSELDHKFQQNIILALIDFPPISLSHSLDRPTSKELGRIDEAKRNLERLPELLAIPSEKISNQLNPLFEFLDEKSKLLKNIKRKKNISDLDFEDKEFRALIDWSYNKTHINKINKISDMISNYNKNVEQINTVLNDFINSVNSFVADSGKTISFDEDHSLSFVLKGETFKRDLRTLSSGEIQLFVILAHLHFNPEAAEASVFIIDEPELSLHVQWQEKFVEKIMGAASNVQFILATHSPSIIQDKISKCIDISR